jgi:hypothetical protein
MNFTVIKIFENLSHETSSISRILHHYIQGIRVRTPVILLIHFMDEILVNTILLDKIKILTVKFKAK